MLRLVLPKGSLEKATLELFEAADLKVERSSTVDYKATIDDPRVAEVRILRPQEIPMYVAEGLFDLGHHRPGLGRGDGAATSSPSASSATRRPPAGRSRWCSPCRRTAPSSGPRTCRQGVRVSTEYPGLTRRYFEGKGIDADIRLSYGATEAKVPDIVDCIVEITETGRALRAAGLKIIDTVLTSYTELVANPAATKDPEKLHAMEQIKTLLDGVMEAREQGAGEAQRRRGRAGRGDRASAVDAVAHGVQAVPAPAASRWRPWSTSPRSTS